MLQPVDWAQASERPMSPQYPKKLSEQNQGTSMGRMPANVSLRHLATVTAGFANEVEAVNQQAAVMYAPTANASAFD